MRHEVIKLTDEAIYPELIKLLESKGEKVWKFSKTWDDLYDILRFNGNNWSRAMPSAYDPTITDVDFIQKYGEKELKGIDSKVAIHCTTPEEIRTVWDMVCGTKFYDYLPSADTIGFSGIYNSLGIAEKQHFLEQGCTIIPASEFIAMNTEPEAAPAWSFKTDEELKNFVATFLATKGDFEQFLSSLRKPAFEFAIQDAIIDNEETLVWTYDSEPKKQYRIYSLSAKEAKAACFGRYWKAFHGAIDFLKLHECE